MLDRYGPQFFHEISLQQLLASIHGSAEIVIPIVQSGHAFVNSLTVSGDHIPASPDLPNPDGSDSNQYCSKL
jgi:hypothetical protein